MNQLILPVKLIFLLLAVFTSACKTAYSPSPALGQASFVKDPITESLFQDQSSTISEEDIRRLLDGEISLPEKARMAIYNFGEHSLSKYYNSWSYDEEYLKLKQNYLDTLSEKMKSSDKVVKTMIIPSILTSASPSVTNLRESAVRVQADLLLVFKTTSDIYYRYKVFKKDEAKAFATVEAVMLDIRTGVVPFTTITTKEKLLVKSTSSMDVQELRKEAEQQALSLALAETADKIVDFLEESP
ncbi:MAG: hypothetical protein AAF824_10925 [Bacteroidota bacterium]